MKPISLTSVITFVFSLFFSVTTLGQSAGTLSSAVWITDCNQSNYFNTSGSGASLIGPLANVFNNANLGTHTQNSGTLIFRGGEVRTFKTDGVSNICTPHLYYRIYPQSGTPGSFNTIDLVFSEDCEMPAGQYFSGGSCVAGNQKWNLITEDGATFPYAPVNLTSYSAGNYVLEVYYEAKGSSTTTTLCNETFAVNNGGNNYKAFFSIQAPVLAGTNPTTCNGTQGSITISGLVAGETYTISYTDDGVAVGPNNLVANVSGEVIIGGLNAGTYSGFKLVINGCTTNLNTVISLANGAPITPVLSSTNPSTCNGTEGSITISDLVAGTTYSISYTDDGIPVGPNNFIANGSGQVIINGLNAGVYSDFELVVNGCTSELNTGIILSNPVLTPSFTNIAPFCAGSTPPTLLGTSNNGITGSWSPSVINNQTSGSYTFTPTAGQCGIAVTKNVTVTPIVTPTFSFGTSLTICAGGSVPLLSATSGNSINGSWSPSTVNNQNSASYTFTPSAGQCANTTSFAVTVTPNITPTFSFGTSLTICEGGSVPALSNTSSNNITGTWSPSVVDNQTSGTYTFTPASGQCATPTSFNVTVTPNVTPTFSFGTSLSICAGGSVPVLPNTSANGITGTWSPSVVDNQTSGTYTFTPTSGLCATTTTFSVTVTPNITPIFSFGASLSICANGAVPVLPNTSANGITGTWSPSVVDNQTSGTYTFTPTSGLCATTTTFSVTVTPNITPIFSFGASLSICANGAVPVLPNTSANGITGTWSPSVVDNQTSGTYTFTPTSGLCATTTTFSVTVTPNITPIFSFGASLSICANGAVPVLPNTSANGITGTWSPSVVDNQTSGTYTFTPTSGLCATTTTFSVTVTPNITPTFSFGTSLSICANGAVPVLPNTSANGITGTWSPSVVDNQTSGTYTFTPTSGLCATITTFSVTVTPNITPIFSFGASLSICANGAVPVLPNTSANGITGTWSPSVVDNQTSGTYTFTPTSGLCATTTTFSVTVTPNITPIFSFGASLSICANGAVPVLPNTSANGITGTWSPSVVDNQTSGTYTFTPTSGLCATTTTFSVTVTPNITPTFSFGTSLSICEGGSVPALINTSSNNITGSWSLSVVDNQTSGTYTFTPDAGQCATITTFSVTVTPNITPTFSFGASLVICAGGAVPVLPSTSSNNVSGSWNPSVVDNQTSGTYTFTPSVGECATPTTFTVNVNSNTIPVFSIGTSITICAGEPVPFLSAADDDGITGTWSPSTVNNQTSATYTFTPDAGQCATPTTFVVTVNPIITPAFSFGTSLSICEGAIAPMLPGTSTNNITGTWSPSIVDNQNFSSYTFTPDAGQCATSTTFAVTVNPNITPVFSFGASLTTCENSIVPTLPNTSDNGITGTWSPSTVSNQASGVYTFTPDAGQCGIATSFSVTITPNTVPTFSFGTVLTICEGDAVPALPNTSDNAIDGTWSPAVVDNQNSGVYTFTPVTIPGQCIIPVTFTVTVNKILTPTFGFGTSLTICPGGTSPLLTTTSTNGITGNWSPSVISNQNSGVYTFTTAAGQCATTGTSLTVTVNPVATVNAKYDTTVNDGVVIPATVFTGLPANVTFNWTNSNPAIGLAASGTGNVPSFTATNKGGTPITATITVTPMSNGCAGVAVQYVITVLALDKDVFVPNVFSPNGDGKNDVLLAYGNYISKLEMRIFNQWGEQVELITDKNKGWDGRHKGKPQPVGVYVYTVNAVMTDGRTINLKGYITLLR